MLEINYGSKFKKDCNLPEQEAIVICFNRPVIFSLKSPALCEAFSFIYPLADSELYTSFNRVSLRSSWQWQCLS